MSYEITFWPQTMTSYNRATYNECQNEIKHCRMLKQTAQNDQKVTMDFENGPRQRLRVSSE